MMEAVRTTTGSKGDRDGRVFKALADPSRRKMLRLLAERDLPLKRIEERFEMSRPSVIKHLRVLRACRLVRVRRCGRKSIHSLNPAPLRVVRDWVAEFEMFWDKHLLRLKRQVEADA